MTRYGNPNQSGSGTSGPAFVLGSNEQRANVFNRTTENGWVSKVGFFGGRSTSSTPAVKLAVWNTDSAMNPTSLVAQATAVNVTTDRNNPLGGQAYEVSIPPFQMWNNKRYAIGMATSQPLAVAYKSSGGVDNFLSYYRFGTGNPTSPFGYTTTTQIGWMEAWMDYQANRPPVAATITPSGDQLTTTPTFTGSFSDADGVYGDRMKAYRIIVRQNSNQNLLWDTGTIQASSAEAASGTFSRVYGGSALTGGIGYKWQLQVQDQFDTWSNWTSFKVFNISATGSVDTLNTPTGRQTTQQPSPFTATWRNTSGLSMNRVKVRIKNGGTVIKQSGEITKSVSNNGAISVTWSEAFGTYKLPWGLPNLTWEMQGRNSVNVWGEWSDGRSFRTNGAPAIPVNLAPKNSIASTTRPVLICSCKETEGDSLTIKARIKTNGGSVIATRTMSYVNYTNGLYNYKYQTTSSDLASYGTYKWDAYSYDGHMYSGETTTEANAAKSSEAVFVYAQGPTVNLTAPVNGGTFAGDVNLDWDDVPNQKSYVVRFYDMDNNLWKQTGTVVSSASGSGIDTYSWQFRNHESYKVQVEVTDTNNLVGTSTLTPSRLSTMILL